MKSDVTVQVDWATGDGTAVAGQDYVAASGRASFQPGQTSRNVPLKLIGDSTEESDESFVVLLSNPTGGATIADGSASVLVFDDDDDQVSTADPITVVAGQPSYCPRNDVCKQVVVNCADTPPTRAFVATGAPATLPSRGVIVLFSGARGTNYWGETNEGVVDELQAAGFEVNRVAWPESWGALAEGPTGPDVAACRPAAVTNWLYETRYIPLDLTWPTGVCGFCVGGNSGGALQAAYGLTEYNLDPIVDAAVLTSGPSLAALAQGCLDDPTFAFSAASSRQVDLSYGIAPDQSGPCLNSDADFESTWHEDGLNDGANDLVYPTTRMEFIQGGKDHTTNPAGVDVYIGELEDAGTPWITKTIYPDAGHGLKPMLSDPAARAGIIAAFTYMP